MNTHSSSMQCTPVRQGLVVHRFEHLIHH